MGQTRLSVYENGFSVDVHGPSEDSANPRDALDGSQNSLNLCTGDWLLFKPLCPSGEPDADVFDIGLVVQFVQEVTITLLGTDGLPLEVVTVSVNNLIILNFYIILIIYNTNHQIIKYNILFWWNIDKNPNTCFSIKFGTIIFFQ